MSRATRRHHLQRVKKSRSFRWGGNLSDRDIGILANTTCAKCCKRWGCCGHVRKYYGVTRQEKLSDSDFKADRYAVTSN